MLGRQADVIRKELRPEAATLVRKITLDYATSLILYAKTCAYAKGTEIVLTEHVREAKQKLEGRRKGNMFFNAVNLLGKTAFGVGVKGTIDAYAKPPISGLSIAIYTLCVMVGFMFVLSDFRD